MLNFLLMYSVVIPTRRPVQKILPTLLSITIQSEQPQRVFIVIDKKVEKKELEEYRNVIIENIGTEAYKKILLITHLDSSFLPNLGVSYVRNYGISLVDAPLLLLVDDDNVFDTDFCARLVSTWKEIKKITKRSSVLIPTEKYKGVVRSHGYRAFQYALGIQRPIHLGRSNKKKIKTYLQDKVFPIKFSSSNCLFGPTKVFYENPFDEHMLFVYEDMDVTMRISAAGYPFYVMLDLYIDHQMREKTPLDQTYIGTEVDAYQKAKNRILLVKNNANFEQKISYFACGLWIHTIFLLQKIIRLAPSVRRKKLIHAIWKGTKDGLLSRD